MEPLLERINQIHHILVHEEQLSDERINELAEELGLLEAKIIQNMQ